MPQANSVCFGCLVDAFEFLAMGARPGRWSILLAHARVGAISPAAVIPSTDARRHGNLRRSIVAFSSEVDAGSGKETRHIKNQSPGCDLIGTEARREEAAIMSKPVKTEAELVAMARAELKVHADCPDGIMIFVLRDGDSWEFRTEADEATIAKPGYPECVAMIVEIGDHLSKQYDVKG